MDETEPQIEGATVIDGVASEPIRDAVIVVEGTMIRSVGPREEVSIPGGAQRINAAGKTIIPGIFCMHEHIAIHTAPTDAAVKKRGKAYMAKLAKRGGKARWSGRAKQP